MWLLLCVLRPRGRYDLSQLKKLFVKFSEGGVRAVVLCGGEPTMREDFEKIILELKRLKLKIFLDTNGDFFNKHKEVIVKNIDIIGLPIDFANKSYRGNKNLENILEALRFIKNSAKKPQVRIGTVVTKENLKEIKDIGRLLEGHQIDLWKIYEYIPVEGTSSSKNRKALEISKEEFREMASEIDKIFSEQFKIVFSERKDRTGAYFLIKPDGTVFVPVDDLVFCKELEIGSVFDQDITGKWEAVVSQRNYIQNAERTFGHSFNIHD